MGKPAPKVVEKVPHLYESLKIMGFFTHEKTPQNNDIFGPQTRPDPDFY